MAVSETSLELQISFLSACTPKFSFALHQFCGVFGKPVSHSKSQSSVIPDSDLIIFNASTSQTAFMGEQPKHGKHRLLELGLYENYRASPKNSQMHVPSPLAFVGIRAKEASLTKPFYLLHDFSHSYITWTIAMLLSTLPT